MKKVGDFYALTWLVFTGLVTYINHHSIVHRYMHGKAYKFCELLCFNFHILAVELQYDDYFEVGRPHEINCSLYTGKVVNSDNVSISWNGPNGVIAKESSRITVIPTTSDGHIHTSTLHFSYISDEDEDTSYICAASLPGEHELLSESFTIRNLTGKLSLTCLYVLVPSVFTKIIV